MVASVQPYDFETFLCLPGKMVLIAPWDKVFFGKDFWAWRSLSWKLEHPISMWCLSLGFVNVNLIFGLFSLWCMCCTLCCGFTHYWICMMNDVSPYFGVGPTWRKDQGLILWLMGCLFTFLLSLSMVSRRKAKALWSMASPMTLSSNTCYGLFMRFLQWNSRLSI